MPQCRPAFSESGSPNWPTDFASILILIEWGFWDSIPVVEETVGSQGGILIVFVESSMEVCATTSGHVLHLRCATTAQRGIGVLRNYRELGNVVDPRSIGIEIAFANEVILNVQTIASNVLR